MSKNRSGGSVVQSEISIKAWTTRLPTVGEARLATCPSCGAASHPVGGGLHLHGHGTRVRIVLGPGGPEEAPALVEVAARRYRCLPCGAVVIVVPRGVMGRWQYSAAAVGLALALWGLVGATAAAVRLRISPSRIVGETAASGWATLQRWARAVRDGDLFPSVGPLGAAATLRAVAAAAARGLSACSNPTTRRLPVEQRAFLGAAQAT